MKNKVLTALFTIGTLFAEAQTDSSYTKTDSILVKPDTIKVGNFFIVKKRKHRPTKKYCPMQEN